jgi:hypothetical protein
MSHSGFCYNDGSTWNASRARRPIREDVPLDDETTNRSKAARIRDGFAVLRRHVSEERPDVLLIFGDDQLETFDFANFPSFAVFVGAGPLLPFRPEDREAAPGATVKGSPDLAASIVSGLVRRGFDPAFCMDREDDSGSIGHAFVRPVLSLATFDMPVVPIMTNCYYAPQITGRRAHALGRAVREVLDEDGSDLRVAVVGSGGLWHTPGSPGAYLDEAFDQRSLELLAAGKPGALAEYFDAYQVPKGDTSQMEGERTKTTTGMPGVGGPQGGTREICNWIAAAAVVDGTPATIVSYTPVYASPLGAGLAYWDVAAGS